MRQSCRSIARFKSSLLRCSQRRGLLTLAIETSCDDTSVAVLEKHQNNSATLHFHSKVTSDNRDYGGVHPLIACESHQKHLSTLIEDAIRNLPFQLPEVAHLGNTLLVKGRQSSANPRYISKNATTEIRKKPDFVTVTRGPGMRAGLITGLNTAKGLAVAWQVPLLGVHHMQAHGLTPRLVSALEAENQKGVAGPEPDFPFLTCLVSGGHTMLVYSKALCDHEILADTTDLAIGDVLDKCARDILPTEVLSSVTDVMYGRSLESFCFPKGLELPITPPKGTVDWSITPPYVGSHANNHNFSYSGIGSSVKRIMAKNPHMDESERRLLGREAMRVAFEHLASRIVFALEKVSTSTLVISGGVASNSYLKSVLREALDRKGFKHILLKSPPPEYCTDNAAMIAWTGMEMWEAGWRTKLDAMAFNKWSIDPRSADGGILGVPGWSKL